MTPKHSANSVAAKARKRMASPPPDYFDAPDYGRAVRRLLYEDKLTGQTHEFLLYISPQRIDQFRVTVNGKPWKERIGFSNFLAGLRKAAGRFSKIQHNQ